MQETQVPFLGREDPLEEGMAVPRTEEPGGLQSMGSQRVRHDWSDLAQMHTHPTYSPLSLTSLWLSVVCGWGHWSAERLRNSPGLHSWWARISSQGKSSTESRPLTSHYNPTRRRRRKNVRSRQEQSWLTKRMPWNPVPLLGWTRDMPFSLPAALSHQCYQVKGSKCLSLR